MQTFPILVDLGLVVSAATALLLLGRALRLPQILSYMVAGLLLGPATGVLEPEQSVALLSELGVALLLFLVGLELSVARVRDVGGTALSAGLAQVAVTALLGALLAALLGFGRGDALVLGLVVTFSSTVVVVKLLGPIGGVGSVAGRTAIGILLLQDVVVAIALTGIGGLGNGESGLGPLLVGLGRAAAGLMALALVAFAAVRWLLPRLFGWVAASAETLLVVSLTWCFAFIVGAELLEISIELGAFTAGLALAQLPYADELVRRVHPLADFFLAVFFVALGAGMDPSAALDLWPQALALSAFVLVLKPALVTGLLLRRRYDARTAFVTGVTLGQVSEFGFVLVALAMASGVVTSPDLVPLTGLVGLVTIGVSALLVPRAPALYEKVAGILPSGGSPEPAAPPALAGHVVVVGMNTLGRMLVRPGSASGARRCSPSTPTPPSSRGCPPIRSSATPTARPCSGARRWNARGWSSRPPRSRT